MSETEDAGCDEAPALVLSEPAPQVRLLTLNRGFVPSFEPLLDGLDHCGLVAEASTALLFLKAPVQFRGKRNRRFL